jgi:hypothetical protein
MLKRMRARKRQNTTILRTTRDRRTSLFWPIYDGAAGIVVTPPAQGFATNSIGDGFDASTKYVFHDYWVVNAGVGHFFPGSLMSTIMAPHLRIRISLLPTASGWVSDK